MIKFTHLKDTSAGTSEKRSRRDSLFPVLTARVYEPGKKFMFCILKYTKNNVFPKNNSIKLSKNN